VSPRKAPRLRHCVDSVGAPVVDETVDHVSASAISATAPRQAIRAELIDADYCAAPGFIARGNAPALALCRELIAAGYDPATPLEAYRGDVLCLRARAIGEAAKYTVEDNRFGTPVLCRWRDRAPGVGAASSARHRGRTCILFRMSAAPTDAGVAIQQSVLISRRAADIPAEKIEWLWPGRLARGKHTCIAGEPGTGKSQLSIAIVAAITTGAEWPCNEGRAPLGSVIILSAEDGAADTIRPRLEAAGADLNRVILVSAVRHDSSGRRAFDLQRDLDLLALEINNIGDVALVVIDPVSSYLGKVDSHKNSEVRGVLEPLSDMADSMRVAVLSITHFSKTGASNTTKAVHRFIGSIAFTGAPRAAFAVIEDAEHDGRRLFLHAKNNLARPPQGLAFRLEQCVIGDGIIASRVV
jgi:AAA domain